MLINVPDPKICDEGFVLIVIVVVIVLVVCALHVLGLLLANLLYKL